MGFMAAAIATHLAGGHGVEAIGHRAAQFAPLALSAQPDLHALADAIEFILSDDGFEAELELVIGCVRQLAAFSDEARQDAELPNQADESDLVKAIAAEAVLFYGDNRQRLPGRFMREEFEQAPAILALGHWDAAAGVRIREFGDDR